MPDYTVPAEDIFLEDALNQLAVYWHPKEAGDQAQKEYEDPIEIICSWQMINESFLDRRSGNEAMSRSKVIVDRDVKELGILWIPPDGGSDLSEGEAMGQLDDESNPLSNEGAFEIRRFDRIPNFDGDEFARIAYL